MNALATFPTPHSLLIPTRDEVGLRRAWDQLEPCRPKLPDNPPQRCRGYDPFLPPHGTKANSWVPGEDDTLIEMRQAGATYREVADRLGRSPTAVKNRGYLLQAKGRI